MSDDNTIWGPNGPIHPSAPASPPSAADTLSGEQAPDLRNPDPSSPDFSLKALQDGLEQNQMQKLTDGAFDGLAPRTPAGYLFDPIKDAGSFDPELDTAARAAFHGERFDNGTAATLYREWTKAASAPEQSPIQDRMEHAACEKALRQNWGGDYDAYLKLANAEVNRIAAAYPKFPIKDMLANTSLGNNAFLIRTLVNRAQARGGK